MGEQLKQISSKIVDMLSVWTRFADSGFPVAQGAAGFPDVSTRDRGSERGNGGTTDRLWPPPLIPSGSSNSRLLPALRACDCSGLKSSPDGHAGPSGPADLGNPGSHFIT